MRQPRFSIKLNSNSGHSLGKAVSSVESFPEGLSVAKPSNFWLSFFACRKRLNHWTTGAHMNIIYKLNFYSIRLRQNLQLGVTRYHIVTPRLLFNYFLIFNEYIRGEIVTCE